MGWPKGKKIPREDVSKRMKTRFANLLKEAKKKYQGDQIIMIEHFSSIVHWDSLCLREYKTRTRRAVKITCGKCKNIRWLPFDNMIKQIRKPFFTGCCNNCVRNMTWLEKGRPRLQKRKITSSGYIKLYHPENPMADKRGEVYEHRLVMSQKLGRPLKSFEIVHHKDGNRANNSPDNLELHPNSEHQTIRSMQNRIKYLEKLLKKYNILFR